MAKVPSSTGYFNKEMQKILKNGNKGNSGKKSGSKKR